MQKLKGIELPVNMMVIVAVAVLVILGLIVILGGSVQGIDPITKIIVENGACTALKSSPEGCAANPNNIRMNMDVDGNGLSNDGVGDTLQAYCNSVRLDVTDGEENECKAKVCGCSFTE